MPEINPLHGDFGGLAQLSGTRTGGLGLPSWGITEAPSNGPFLSGLAEGLGSLTSTLQQNKALAQQDEQAKAAAAIAAEQKQYDRSQDAKDFGLREKQFDLQLNKHAMELAQQEKADKLEAAQSVLFAIAQMPESKWNASRVGIIGAALKAGLIDEDQGKSYISMEHSQIIQSAKAGAVMANKTLQYQALKDMEKGDESGSGVKLHISEGGEVTYESGSTKAELTTSTATGIQENVLSMQKDGYMLKKLRDNFNDDYLTYRGQGGAWFQEKSEKAKGTIAEPILGAIAEFILPEGVNPKKYVYDSTKYLNTVEQFFQRYRKQITGAQAALQELADLRQAFISKDMSPSQFQGSLDAILDKYIGDLNIEKGALVEGLDVTPSGSMEATEADVQKIMSTYKISREEALKNLQANGHTYKGNK